VIDLLHAVPYTEWGSGSVWESQNGTTVPVMARNVVRMSTWTQSMAPEDVLSRVLALRSSQLTLPPSPPSPADRPLRIRADVPEAHGLDLRPFLNASGYGLVWAAVAPVTPLEGSAMPDRFGLRRPALLQVTNLGITVKDSPYSTLIAVTRLDNAGAVAGARVAIVNAEGKQLWNGVTGQDGVAMAPALPMRSPRQTYHFSYLVTAQKDDDVAWIGSDWTGDLSPWNFGIYGYALDEVAETLRGSIFTDRGVYTRGETVSVKGIFRGDSASGIGLLPAGTRLTVVTYDAQAREYDRRSMTLNQWSSADWKLTIPGGRRARLVERSGVSRRSAGSQRQQPEAAGHCVIRGSRIPQAGFPRGRESRSGAARDGLGDLSHRRGRIPVRHADRRPTRAVVCEPDGDAVGARSNPAEVRPATVCLRLPPAGSAGHSAGPDAREERVSGRHGPSACGNSDAGR
jgi:hypothetical protein